MSSRDAQVIIAGAGPVGLALGLALCRRGIRVIVCEAEPQLSEEARASTLHPPTLEMFDEWGVIAEILARGKRVDRLQYWERETRSLVAEFAYSLLAGDTPYPFRFQCPQHQVTPVLAAAIGASATGEVRMGHRLVDLAQSGDGVEAVFQTASGRVTLAADYLCGADGAASVARSRLGMELEGSTYEDRFLLVGTDIDFPRRFPGMGPVSYVFDPGEWVIIMHLPDLVRTVFRLAPDADADEALGEASIRRRMRAFLGEELDFELRMRSIYRVHKRVARSFRDRRVLLAGDAAHINNPAGGMGMNSGIHDAYALAGALATVLAGGPDTALEHYATTRRTAAVESVQSLSNANYRRLVVDGEERERRNRELAAMAADPAAARAYLLKASMLDQPVGRRAA